VVESGQQDTGFNNIPASITLVSGPGTLTGATSGTFFNGVASFSLQVSTAGHYLIRLTAGNLITDMSFDAAGPFNRRQPFGTGSGSSTPNVYYSVAPLSQAAQTTLSTVRAKYGFIYGGNYFVNYSGMDEKWFLDRTGTQWYVITPAGRILRWLGGSSFADPIDPTTNLSTVTVVDSMAWDDPNNLFQAPLNSTLTTAQQTALSNLRAQYGFVFNGSYSQSYHNLNAKWFLDRSGNTTTGWYVIRTNGDVQHWNGVIGGVDSFTTVATVSATVWDDPNLLLQADLHLAGSWTPNGTQQPSNTATTVSNLRAQYGFVTTGNYFQSYHGLNAKWVMDRSGNSTTGWYLIRTNGDIQHWGGVNGLGQDILTTVATVSPLVWDDPTLLLQADMRTATAWTSANQLAAINLRETYGFIFTGSYFQSYNGLNAKWIMDRSGNSTTGWYVIRADGRIQHWTGTVNGVDQFTTIATLNPLVWDDPSLLLFA
jgi:hypothetical protein